MKQLNIDIETYSDIVLKDAGLYKYVESEVFGVLLFAYSVDFGEVKIIDLAQGEEIPTEILEAMADDNIIKHAYNAAFEYNALKKAGFNVGSRKGWRCTMFHAMYLGYPAGLSATGEAIGLPQDKKKLSTGSALIRYFSVPCKATKSNGGRTRNLPHHDIDKWNLFKEYCKQDVEAEKEIYHRVSQFAMPEREQKLWELSDEMNALGVKVDMKLVEGTLAVNEELTKLLTDEAKELTGIKNPKSTVQVKEFLNQNVSGGVENTTKATVSALLERDDLSDDVRRFLKLRQELAKTSIAKYEKMKACVGSEDRVRGLLQVYGANRTGRWAGRLVQVQNLPRNYIKNLELARDIVINQNLSTLQMLFGNASDTLSQLIRTTFIPRDGYKFIVADYSAIEARVVAWLAGEEWVNEVFATHGKIYEATASQMFGIPIDKIVKGQPEYEFRQKGKVATLALGYQGGVNALKTMGAEKMGLSEEEMVDIVTRWRQANSNIVNFWYAVQNAAIKAVEQGTTEYVNGLTIQVEYDLVYGQSFLTIELPSGRKLFYPRPTLSENQFGRQALHFYVINQETNKWQRESSYGGKLVENIVQAVARDCLAELLIELKRLKYPVVMHIHDEVVIEAKDDLSLEEVCKIMGEPIPWAPGLVLKGAGFESQFYMKD